MQPGPDEIRACPDCGKPFRTHTMLSGNTFGARYWSDGKCDAPMLPESPVVARCPHCRSVFWIEDTTLLGEDDPVNSGPVGEGAELWNDAQKPVSLDGEGYEEAIALNSDVERERFLRVRYWHAVNDPHREAGAGEDGGPFMNPQHRDNLKALLVLLNEDQEPSERIMKAEVFRELGLYREALWLLSDVPADISWAASQITAMARAGISRVFELRSA